VEEFFVGAFEGDFGVNAQFPRKIGDDEEEVSDFGLEFTRGGGALLVLCEFLADFGEFFVDLFGDAGGVGPIEANFTGLFLKFGGTKKGWEALAYAVEVGFFFVAFFGAFDVFPLGEDAIGAVDSGVAIDVGVAADELVADASGDLVEIEAVVFLRKFSVEDDLKKEVAEFFLEVFLITGADGRDGFVGFLDEI